MKKKIIILGMVLIITIGLIYLLNYNRNPYDKYNIKNYDYDQAIIKIKNRIITLAPINYDGDNYNEFKNDLFNLELADKVSYYNLNINSVLKNEKKKSKYKYTKVSENKIFEEINTNGVIAYIWVKENKVYKIVTYGETIIQK